MLFFFKGKYIYKENFFKRVLTVGWRKTVAMVALASPFPTRYVLVHTDVVLVCNFMHSTRSFFAVLKKKLGLRYRLWGKSQD